VPRVVERGCHIARLHRFDLVGQPAGSLEIDEIAGDVLRGDVKGQGCAAHLSAMDVLRGLHVDDVRGERAGVTAERRVGQ
jgi:hypothetical protein